MSNIVVSTEKLTKVYPIGRNQKVVALNGLDLEVEEGHIFGILGPNGSGKTTLCKLLLGHIFPTQGKAYVLGKRAGDIEAKKRIGYLAENAYFYEFLSGEELLYFTGRIFGINRVDLSKRVEELLDLVRLKEARKRKLKEYSKGMLQRIGIARALINDPDLLLLDEPTSGLDPIGQKEMREIILKIQERGKTILLNSHHLSEIGRLSQSIVILNEGKAVESGKVEELLKRGEGMKIVASQLSKETQRKVEKVTQRVEKKDGEWVIHVPNRKISDQLINLITSEGGSIRRVEEEKLTLEDLFIEAIRGS